MRRFPARLFDLGGSGLKTAIISECPLDTAPQLTSRQNLGQFPAVEENSIPPWDEFRSWLRSHLPLDEEVASGFRFGFSLAEISNLWSDHRVRDPPPANWVTLGEDATTEVAVAFGLPPERCFVVEDGEAHLLATVFLSDASERVFPLVNFSVGTGVGVGCTNSRGEVRTLEMLKISFGCDPWCLECPAAPETGLLSPLGAEWSLSGRALEKMRSDGIPDALERFYDRWRLFIESTFLPLCEKLGWETPKVIGFSGGVASAGLFQKLAESGLCGLRVILGPRDGGLMGALMAIPEGTSHWVYESGVEKKGVI